MQPYVGDNGSNRNVFYLTFIALGNSSAECGFSCRTHLYRIFKTKEGCSPTEWRNFHTTEAAQNGSN